MSKAFSVFFIFIFCTATYAQNIAYSANSPSYCENSNPMITITGFVRDYNTNRPVKAIIKFYSGLGEKTRTVVSSEKDGSFAITLPCGKDYQYVAMADEYIELKQNINASKMEYDTEIHTDLFLLPIKPGSVIKLENIFFEFGTANFEQTSILELEQLVSWMNKHPEIKVEISGHTDNNGAKERNLEVSQQRADAVATYLTEKGIDSSRVIAKGYGDSQPMFPNSSERGRKLNRRVELRIIE